MNFKGIINKNNMLSVLVALLMACSTKTSALGTANLPAVEAVDFVDLERYAGTWYEIARFPFERQKDCVGTTATYELEADFVRVINRCYYKSFEGRMTTATGRAKVKDKETNAKLRVSFFWPFYGDYWVISLGENYDYAVVSMPSRKNLWILYRDPVMPKDLYAEIVQDLRSRNFDTSRLISTLQK